MSTQPGQTGIDGRELPEDPEAVVDELSADSGEDYDPPEQIDLDQEAAEADLIDQAAAVPHEDEGPEPADDD